MFNLNVSERISYLHCVSGDTFDIHKRITVTLGKLCFIKTYLGGQDVRLDIYVTLCNMILQ